MTYPGNRSLAIVLIAALAVPAAALPASAQASLPTRRPATLASLSPASLQVLATPTAVPAATPQAGTSSDKSFFRTRRGATAIALMIAGATFTVWSINHDRKPVKSPIR
jgi:hypothetical protein